MPFVTVTNAGSSIHLKRTPFIVTLFLLALVTLSCAMAAYTGLPATDMSILSADANHSFSVSIFRRTTTLLSPRQILPRDSPNTTYIIILACISGISLLSLITITILYIRLRRHMTLFRRHMMSPTAPRYVVNPSWVGNTSRDSRNADFQVPMALSDMTSSTRLNERNFSIGQDS